MFLCVALALLVLQINAWNVSDCMNVADAWLKGRILYNWNPTTKQYVTSGKGLYRSDCSGNFRIFICVLLAIFNSLGFVSAAWDIAPPGNGCF
jgi:hypothetical protein